MIGFLLIACSKPAPVAVIPTEPPAVQSTNPEVAKVLVVMNDNSPTSMKVASYYVSKRKIPRANLVSIKTDTKDDISPERYKTEIETPIKAALAANPKIEYIVLTKGIPLRLVDQGGYSVDATLASHELKFAPIGQTPGTFGITEGDEEGAIKRNRNPYFGATEPFSHAKYGMYLVTRIIGYTEQDCFKLVDNSLNAKASKAPILLDSQPIFQPGSGYWELEKALAEAEQRLSAANQNVYYEKTENFSNGREPLMGYASWGSNDKKFDPKAYSELRFVPGAIAETFVSTSARTFDSTRGGQSLIADLVAQGVTGVKGYVSEPFTFALCRPEILFDRYTKGFNLAEAFYAASPVVKWKDIVVGDPLCRPFK